MPNSFETGQRNDPAGPIQSCRAEVLRGNSPNLPTICTTRRWPNGKGLHRSYKSGVLTTVDRTVLAAYCQCYAR